MLRAAASVAQDPEAASLAAAIVLVEEGHAADLASTITGRLRDGTPEERADLHRRVLIHHLGSAIGCYLTAERGHSWMVSWSGPLGLLDGKGAAKDPYAMAESLLDDPSSGGRLRRSLGGVGQLKNFRIAAVDISEPQPPSQEFVGLVPDVCARRRRWDVVLTTSSVVLHPVAGGAGAFLRRAMASQGITGPTVKDRQRRLEALFSLPSPALMGQAPGAVVVELSDLRNVRKRRGWAVELQLDGDTRAWRLQCSSKSDCDAMMAMIQELLVAEMAPAQQTAA